MNFSSNFFLFSSNFQTLVRARDISPFPPFHRQAHRPPLPRPKQAAHRRHAHAHAFYLTRMGQTLRLVQPPLLWVVVEAGKPTPESAAALCRTSVIHRYVGCCDKLNDSSSSSVHYRPHQMNAALELIENHRHDGIIYFADEEDVYSLHLFDRLRQIRY
jgi:hypothetical protein